MNEENEHRIYGISLTEWAAACSLMNKGVSFAKILEALKIERPIWDMVFEEWNDLLASNPAFAEQYSIVYKHPYVQRFECFEQKETADLLTADAYYKVFCHIQEAQNFGIDFLSILETHHKLTWEKWSAFQSDYISFEMEVYTKGSSEEKEKLQYENEKYLKKWEAYWKSYYQNKNLNLGTDINF